MKTAILFLQKLGKISHCIIVTRNAYQKKKQTHQTQKTNKQTKRPPHHNFLHNILCSSLIYGLFTMLYHVYLPHFVSVVEQVFISSQPPSQLRELQSWFFFAVWIIIIFNMFHTPEYFGNSSDYLYASHCGHHIAFGGTYLVFLTTTSNFDQYSRAEVGGENRPLYDLNYHVM